MTSEPRAVIGMPAYNRAEYLPEALESLLSQTHPELALIVADDCSTDETPSVVRGYATDARLSYVRNQRRLGMIMNWRNVFELARERHPAAEYFAWASDHDAWHPRWLAALLAELDGRGECVLAYPLNEHVAPSGEVVQGPWAFDTVGLSRPDERLRAAFQGMVAGDMVYGLFRASALARAGVFRSVLLPDRLLLSELSVYGEFAQVAEILWYRRSFGRLSMRRQRASFFPDSKPFHSNLPWALTHGAALAHALAVQGAGRPEISRSSGARLATAYLGLGVRRTIRRRARDARRPFRRLRRRAVARALRTVEVLRGAGSRAPE